MGASTLYLVLALGGDRYALEAASVVEVLPVVRLKHLPGAPSGVAGLMNFRGAAVPVIDLGLLAGGGATPASTAARIIVMRLADAAAPGLLALLVPSARDTARVEASAFAEPRVTGSARWPGAVATTPDGVLQRVHVAELLTAELRAALDLAA